MSIHLFFRFLDAPVHGEIRLYNSYNYPYSHSGRVEIYTAAGKWGTVAGLWTKENAEVVCRQLGFDIPSKIELYHFFLAV